MNQSKPKSVVDSPWYWVYVFGAAGLAALLIMGPKFARRQTIDERNYQARQRANQQAMGQQPDTELSTEENRIITLAPLFGLVGTVFVVAWALVWWQVFGKRWRKQAEKESESAPVSNPTQEGPAP